MLSEVGEVFHIFSRLIIEFGPYVFGLVSLLLIIILLFILSIYLAKGNANKNSDNNINQDISEMIRSAVHAEFSHINNNDSKVPPKENLTKIFIRISTALKHTIKELVHVVNADRIAVYLFHNGTHSLNNVPFLKASCICEVDNMGLASYNLIRTHKDIPINLLDDIVELLIRQHEFVIYKNQSRIDAIMSKLFFDEKEDATCIVTGIFEIESGELLGFIIAEYDDQVDEFTKEDLKFKTEKLREIAKHTSASMQVIAALR